MNRNTRKSSCTIFLILSHLHQICHLCPCYRQLHSFAVIDHLNRQHGTIYLWPLLFINLCIAIRWSSEFTLSGYFLINNITDKACKSPAVSGDKKNEHYPTSTLTTTEANLPRFSLSKLNSSLQNLCLFPLLRAALICMKLYVCQVCQLSKPHSSTCIMVYKVVYRVSSEVYVQFSHCSSCLAFV